MTNAEIKKLIKKLPLWVKAAQLTQLNASFIVDSKAEITGSAAELAVTEKQIFEIGSILNFAGAKEMREIQSEHLHKSVYKLPLIFMMDVIHGYKTIFPIPLALGCTFDEELIEQCAEISAVEAKLDGVQITFSPMVDLVRDARWGRCMESTGEDPFLNGKLARAMIRGYKKGGLGVCVKHFVGYSAAEAGKDYNTTDISERSMYEYYLRGYEACIKEKPELVMTSFNALNGVPVNGHKDLLIDLLRGKWGFNGTVISDYAAVTEMVVHGYLSSYKECAFVAADNEIDIEMMSSTYIRYFDELVREGKIDESKVDEMLYRVLKLKNKFHLFENPYYKTDEKKAEESFLCARHRHIARVAAERSCVLLKNKGVLPLKKDANIALAGPFASEKDIIGAWCCRGDKARTISVSEGFENYFGKKFTTTAGCSADLLSDDLSNIGGAVTAVSGSEIVVICIGEKSCDSGESASRAKLEITRPQAKLVKAIKESGKTVVSLVFGGRPQVLTEIEKYSDAILYVWQPGTEGGNAIVRLLFGDVAPTGKLTMSFPRTTGQCPIYYNAFSTGRPRMPDSLENNRYSSGYRDCLNAPLYPFGYGLTYTDFELSDMKVSDEKLDKKGEIVVSATLKNIGKRKGEETVQLYLHDLYASAVRPVKELKDYQKVVLERGEKTTVRFTVSEKMLKFYNSRCEYVSEPGEFDIMLGTDSEHFLRKTIKLI